MSDDRFEFEGREYKSTPSPEVDPQGLEKFHDTPNLPRCRACWNLEPACSCSGVTNTPVAEEIIGKMIEQLHPSVARPTVAGVTPERRDQLLDAYARRGVDLIEQMLNAYE